jgi:tetratricopeptide (TPR) repeat protein
MTKAAVAFRSLALFAILYQFRFLADDLADTPVFLVTLLAAFAIAVFLAKKAKPLPAIIIIGFVPWIVRLFIAVPGIVVGRSYSLSVAFDSLLLNFDRNNFVSLLPFYWAAVTTWFSLRSRVFLRAVVIADVVLLIVIFGFTGIADAAVYRWPIVMIDLLAEIIFLQALALLFSLPPEISLYRREKAAAIAVLLLLVCIGAMLFLKPSQERAAQKGGGLLEPKLFSFDFSQFLRLDTEISMGDDLIMIVKKDRGDDHILMRRAVMSGYNKKQGFFRIEEMDEKTHPQRLPSRPVSLSPAEFKDSQRVYQEYFLVNFDASAFIGMKEPIEIIPYETWDSSSFKAAYAVESLTSNAIMDIAASGLAWPAPSDLGLSEKEFAAYTAYGADERIRSLAEEVTWGYDGYVDKVYAIHNWLKFGDFRYSLKPGIAPDGDQLAWFLFQSKKGYCTYYAFAMTLMLRSLGIPARIAAGFFLDPDSGIFEYYPVRSDMAHAWVEVPFPSYGWIECDPTSEFLAEGEEFRFSSGVDPRLLERLMREILENRSQLKVKMGPQDKGALDYSSSLARIASVFMKKIAIPLVLLSLILIFVLIRCGYLFLSGMAHNRRRKAIYLWRHTRRRLRLAGLGCPPVLTESEWALRTDALIHGTYPLYLGAAAARFAPEYQNEDFTALQGAYRNFSESYRKAVSPWRRFLAWVFPPAALVRRSGELLLAVLLVFFISTDARAQDGDFAVDADELYNEALDAEFAEYWERAIDLYKVGSVQYPLDARFPRALGHLYYSRSLFSLAWDEYRKVEHLNPYDVFILLRLANTAAYLNHDRTSVTYLEKLLAINPDNKEAINSLGWMYYKVHRLGDGERLLVSAIERFGEEADFSMTLATIYSDMYRYDEGKYWYQKAITAAEAWQSFVAVAHYNLSILESRFYRYNLAMDEANASIETQNRASGLLSRGEIYLRRLDLEKAQVDFQDARELDSSPLAKLSLAQTYQISGRLEEARLYALDCLKTGDHTWMINYGIDPVRYKRDVHEILSDTYSGLARAERFVPCQTPGKKIRSAFRSVSFRFYAAVYRQLYQKYSLAAGDAYGEKFVDGNAPLLEQYNQYLHSFKPYPRRALEYLNRAQDFELPLIPAAAASYNLDRGTLLKDRKLMLAALDALDPVWECDLIAECFREIALHGRTRATRQIAAAELFALNRGALLQAGIGLPVDINLHNADGKEKRLYRALAKAGFIRSKGARFTLNITIGTGAASCELIDTDGEGKPLRQRISLQSLSTADQYGFARALSNVVFRVE